MNTNTRLIPLTQGKFATVDSCDYEWIMQWKWHAHKRKNKDGYTWYAMRHDYRPSRKIIQMHNEIAVRCGLAVAPEYDHIDRNGLNNARYNLRPCNRSQNLANKSKRKGTTSRYKGVYWDKSHMKWHAQITINYKQKYLGLFTDEKEASEAYVKAASAHFGEFACFD